METFYWYINIRDIEAIIIFMVMAFSLGLWIGSKL